MIKTKTKLFNISSANATNGSYKSSVLISLPDLSFHHEVIKKVSFSVEHCEIPNSFYIINYTNNLLVINNTRYIITVGNYYVRTFINFLIAILPTTFTISYNSISNKLTFTNTSIITINSSLSTINKIIGLSNTDLIGALSYDLPYVVNFLPIPRINFKSNYFKFNNYNTTDKTSDLFLSLQNNTGQLNMINYINQTQTEFLLQDTSKTTFNINVMDDYNNLINFNNIDWTMTLIFKIDFIDFKQSERVKGYSKNNLYTLFDLGLTGVVKHSNVLLRAMILCGFFSSIISLIVSCFFLLYKIIYWNSFQLGLAPILVGFFGLASLQIMIIGLIGEYVSIVLSYSKNLPLVIEKERINFN
jgi:hypothetical protein